MAEGLARRCEHLDQPSDGHHNRLICHGSYDRAGADGRRVSTDPVNLLGVIKASLR